MKFVIGYEKRDHIEHFMNFVFDALRTSTLPVLPSAVRIVSLSATVTEIRVLKLEQYADDNFKKALCKR